MSGFSGKSPVLVIGEVLEFPTTELYASHRLDVQLKKESVLCASMLSYMVSKKLPHSFRWHTW